MIPPYLFGDILSLDCETALLGDRVCEIGMSLFKNCELVSEWGMLVNPTIPIDPEAIKVHHIHDSDVESAPTFADVAWCIYNSLSAADVWIIYNADYDIGVLRNEFLRLNMTLPCKYVIDPFILFKKYNKFNKGKKLVNAAEKYGIPYVGAHRACNDATVAGRVLFKIAATKPDFPKTLDNFVKLQRRWCEEQYIDLNNYFVKIGKQPIDKPKFEYYEGKY